MPLTRKLLFLQQYRRNPLLILGEHDRFRISPVSGSTRLATTPMTEKPRVLLPSNRLARNSFATLHRCLLVAGGVRRITKRIFAPARPR